MAERETPLTLGAIARNLGPLAMAFGLVVGGAVAWTTTQARVAAVEKDVTELKTRGASRDDTVKTEFETLRSSIDLLTRRIDLFMCAQDPKACSTQVRLGEAH